MIEAVWVEVDGVGLVRIVRSDILSVTHVRDLRKVVLKMHDGTSIYIKEQSARSVGLIE
jgi:hypothetical protein